MTTPVMLHAPFFDGTLTALGVSERDLTAVASSVTLIDELGNTLIDELGNTLTATVLTDIDTYLLHASPDQFSLHAEQL